MLHQYNHKSLKACLLASGVASILAATPVAAQEQDAGVFVLEEITVTAQKREQALSDVPIAVSAVTGSMLEDRGTKDVFDLALSVPALQAYQNSSPLNTAYRLRGVGNDPNIPNFEPAVGLFIDGVYMPRSGLGIGDLVDIERVEILKGPQSTLYGKNVTGRLPIIYNIGSLTLSIITFHKSRAKCYWNDTEFLTLPTIS